MENLDKIALILEERREELLTAGLINSFLFSSLAFLIVFIILYLILKNFYEKRFSFSSKKKIFNSIKNFAYLEGIEIIEYKERDRNFEDILHQNYDFNVYKEEDVFVLKIKNVLILMAEVELQKRIRRGKNTRYVTVFRGIVYRIPQQIFNYYPSPNIQNIISYMGNTYILRPKNRDLFELKLLKKINPETLKSFLSELKDNIEFAINCIK